MRAALAISVIILAAIALAIFGTTTPSPISSNAPDSDFSSARAMDHVRVIAAAPHPTGSAANAEVRAYIQRELQALGMEVSTQTAALSDEVTERLASLHERGGSAEMAAVTRAADLRLVNITAILRGTDPSLPAILLMSHHDTVVGSPGASDDTTGVAVSLETIRALKATGPLKRDVIVLATDAEELGLHGARYFFTEDPLRNRVGAVINMEARGGGGRTGLFETSEMNGEAVRVFADNVDNPVGTSLSVLIYRLLPNNTDLTPALAGDYAAYNFAFIGRPGQYHSPIATPDNLDEGSVQDMGAQVLDLTRALADADTLPQPSPDLAFFDAFGLTTFAFAPWLGWLFLALGVAGYIAAVAGRFEARTLLRGAGRAAALLLLVALATWLLNSISGPGSGELAYYDRLAAIPRLEWVALLGSLAVAITVLRAGGGGESTWAGFALVPLILGIGLQSTLPAAAYVVTIPVMLAGVGAVLMARARTIGTVIAAVLAALVVGYNISLAHQVMQGIGPGMPMAVALPVVLAAMVLLPFWPTFRGRTVMTVAAGLMLLAAAIALWVRLDPVADTVAVYAVPADSKSK